jgi:hypothetical protein
MTMTEVLTHDGCIRSDGRVIDVKAGMTREAVKALMADAGVDDAGIKRVLAAPMWAKE